MAGFPVIVTLESLCDYSYPFRTCEAGSRYQMAQCEPCITKMLNRAWRHPLKFTQQSGVCVALLSNPVISGACAHVTQVAIDLSQCHE